MKNTNTKELSREVIFTTDKTPIEVALQIDENGMTTASNLYSFLELEPKNFSHWSARNIKNNKFAIENEDYCYENHLLKDECYPMDAIEHNTKLREALTLLVDDALLKYGLQTEEELKYFKRTTLFDREPVVSCEVN